MSIPLLTLAQIVALRQARGDPAADSLLARSAHRLGDRIHLNALGMLDSRRGLWIITRRGRQVLDQVDRHEQATSDAAD